MTVFDTQQTDLLLTTTRAVRKRLDLERPVPREVVLECIELATHAPSPGNNQRWRWVVVTDAGKKHAIAELYAASYAAYIAPRKAMIAADDDDRWRITASSDHLADHMAECPVLVIPCLLEARPDQITGEAPAGFWGGILPAVWSFQLALRSRGLGSALTTLHLNHEREVGEILAIPETVTQAALLPVAYTKGTDFRPARRRPAVEVTYFDQWGVKATPAGEPRPGVPSDHHVRR
jgi:nitroreductase